MTQPPLPHGAGPATPRHLSAASFLDLVLDPGTWRSWDTPPIRGVAAGLAGVRRPDEALAARMGALQSTRVDEALVTGMGELRGTPVAGEFAFRAGSVGVAAADRLVAAVERATAERLPLVASPASGGMRMQEGTAAFVRMVGMAGAIARHKAARLPYLVYLRHPTTGGVLASWGSLGHVTFAEPDALIGFTGPRVYEQLSGEPFPAGVQTAENLHAHGLIDGVVAPERFAEVAARVLAVLGPSATGAAEQLLPAATPEPPREVAAWELVTRSRRPERPGLRSLLEMAAEDVTVLDGSGSGGADRGLALALARFGEARCVLIGQDREAQRSSGPIGPAGLRKARRGMAIAAELGLPLVTVIDTPGAALSREAEEGGLAAEIAGCLASLVDQPGPTLSVLLGEGVGGVAIALLPADRTIAAQHAWLSPLPLEGASALLHHTVARAPEVAREQGIRALDLLRLGVVDQVVAEHPDAADEPRPFCRRLGRVIADELGRLARLAATERAADRCAATATPALPPSRNPRRLHASRTPLGGFLPSPHLGRAPSAHIRGGGVR
jgi:acyl-CoA carboxylase subunit beta